MSGKFFYWPSVGVPGKISNSIAESFEFWKKENVYNMLALIKPYDAMGFLLNVLHHTDLVGHSFTATVRVQSTGRLYVSK
jgi:hypothetical protein